MVSLDNTHPTLAQWKTGIHGVFCQPLGEVAAQGGPVLHMLRSDSPFFTTFGEVYFSLAEPGFVKAWKRHRIQTQCFAVPHGMIEVAIHDDRKGSPSAGQSASFLLGRPGHYNLLTIPRGLWYGFTCQSEATAIIANCTDIPHSPDEAERLPHDSPLIPYTFTSTPFLSQHGKEKA